MEKLPQEVFDQIAQLLYDDGTAEDFRNANYLCSGFFRACWELREHVWHKITIRPGKLDTFVALYRSFGRHVLKEAAYVLELPEGFDVDSPRASGEPGALDELVTDQISRLFHALKTLELRRKAAREDLGALLPTLPRPPHLERAVLSFLGPEAHKRLGHAAQMPDLVGGAPADPFSLGLGAWCRNLTQLRIHAVLDESFFWPEDGEGILWPNMELLEVKFHAAAPSGFWYFHGPRGWNPHGGYLVGDSDENDECNPSQWRTDPVPDVLYPFLTAYARSARRMPRLKSEMIWSPIHWAPSGRDDYYAVDGLDYMHHKMNGRDVGWGIGYRAPGTRERPELWRGRRNVRGDVRQFWWSLALDRLPGKLRDEIDGIGREEHGDRLDDYECTFGDQNPWWFTMFVPDERNGVRYLP
ncbi:hypothetical protein CMUS01_09626 [Colletotrichum musicola]|uniref:Uncharacterized protein n=1 Tax=Colletotrichum musicola TaxID=2175873 RepID=A0A8H6NAZ8_9PEZI|nr:hypothetical protein CMUS01_09626 [Colletotrichum musicola]